MLLVIGGAILPSSDTSAAADAAACVTTGPLPGLTSSQAANARTVVAVASARGGEPGALVALTIAIAESGLRDLGNSSDPNAETQLQGVGSDHDSVGLFQQRASWGTVAQRMDPVVSTNLLMDRLTAQPHWQSRDPVRTAQTVQVSVFDGIPRPANDFSAVVGANYRAALPKARLLALRVTADGAHQPCRGVGGSPLGSPPPGPVGPHGLPGSYVVPPSSAAGHAAVLAALRELGKPYVFDASGPQAFDCSGLMRWAWQQAGVALPHYTVSQFDAGRPTDSAHMVPGDLVLIPGSDGTLTDPQHVGLYIGAGLVVEAPQTGDVVKVVSYQSFISGGLSGLRHIA